MLFLKIILQVNKRQDRQALLMPNNKDILMRKADVLTIEHILSKIKSSYKLSLT